MLKARLASLRRRFSPSRLLRTTDGLETLTAGSASQEWVLGRGFCAFSTVDASAIPANRRKGYAAIQIRKWAPFSDASSHVEWVGPHAMVWAWSDAQVRGLGDGTSLASPRRILPESLFRGGVRDAAAELLEMREGFEGRVWAGQALVASQWWATPPGLQEWNAFLRGAGRPAAPLVPLAEPTALAAAPWSRRRATAVVELTGQHRNALQWLLVGLAAMVLAIPATAGVRLLVKSMLLERVIARESEGAAPILAAREAAERDSARAEALRALRPPARQLELLSAIVAATPGNWTLLEWRMPDPTHVEVVMQATSPDAAAIVRGWEGAGLFRDVAVELGRASNELTVKATLGPPAAATPEPSA